MFDLSWGEMMLIGAVALIVIGPKDLPRTLRAVGQTVGKVKRMASEFQGQFNQAMREAELDNVRKEVEGINRAAQAGLNPAKAARDEIKRAIDGKPDATKSAAAKATAAGSVDLAKGTAASTATAAASASGATAITTDAAPGSTTASASAVTTSDPGAVAAPAPTPRAAATPVPPAPVPVPVADREEAKP